MGCDKRKVASYPEREEARLQEVTVIEDGQAERWVCQVKEKINREEKREEDDQTRRVGVKQSKAPG